jgi:hypothetical protein
MQRLAFLLMLVCAAPAFAEAPRLIPMTGPTAPAASNGLPRVFTPAQPASPGLACRQAIRSTEKAMAIPEHLMAAIARVESGRIDAQGGVHPWPWTINAEGVGHYYETKAEAIAAVRAMQAKGMKSIDVGCMQVNLMFHPAAFASLDQAFDPATNVRYAATFLNRLKDQTGSWPKATAMYHSATPDLGNDYERRVAAVWPDEKARQTGVPVATGGNVWTTNVFSANAWNTSGPPLSPVGGGQMLGNRAELARIIPIVAPGTARGLDAYRTAPIPVTGRPVAWATRTPPG